jgi:hypothetical protein
VGIEKLKQTHQSQINEFEEWARQNEWEKFHYNHYDWWVFPVDRRSAYGVMWVVYPGDVEMLKVDAAFMHSYCRGVTLVAASWGWDLEARAPVASLQPGQCWHNWPIRLYKAAQSVKLFGIDAYFDSLRAYALTLLARGESFQYNGRDLSELFK